MPDRPLGSVRAAVFLLWCLSLSTGSLRCAAQTSASSEPIGASSVRAEAGAVVARGNSDKESFNAGFEVTRERVRWKQALGLSGVYAGDATGTTGQRWDVRTQSDYRFHPQGFSFASSRYEEDRFSGFEYQMALSMGLGWRFFDDDKTRLIAQIGSGYRRLHTRDAMQDDGLTPVPGQREEGFVEQGRVEFERALNDATRLRDMFLVESGANNTFIRNDISLQVRIMTSLALAVGYSLRYNTHPPAGFDTTDALTAVNLVYEID